MQNLQGGFILSELLSNDFVYFISYQKRVVELHGSQPLFPLEASYPHPCTS